MFYTSYLLFEQLSGFEKKQTFQKTLKRLVTAVNFVRSL